MQIKAMIDIRWFANSSLGNLKKRTEAEFIAPKPISGVRSAKADHTKVVLPKSSELKLPVSVGISNKGGNDEKIPAAA
jgi:hypothetical protein